MGPSPSLLAAVAAMLIVAVIVGVRFLTGRSRAVGEQMRTLLAAEAPEFEDPRANFFGRESVGIAQMRGNGQLALGSRELVFVMWVPRRVVRIPRAAISGIDTPRVFLAKSCGLRLLCVSWRDESGQIDRDAWWVKDLDGWVERLSPR